MCLEKYTEYNMDPCQGLSLAQCCNFSNQYYFPIQNGKLKQTGLTVLFAKANRIDNSLL